MKTTACVGVLVLASLLSYGDDSIRLGGIFTDHMVLQRDMPVRIWGWAAERTPVTVQVGGVSGSALTDHTGRWQVLLPELAAGGPHTLQVIGHKAIDLKDVLVGDVWLCSGQSNMAWPVDTGLLQVTNGAKERTNADLPSIRLFTVGRSTSAAPLANLDGSGWQVCSPETVGPFSAVGYFFGRELHRHLGVPVGLINSSYGGTAIEAWTSAQGLQSVPHMAQFLDGLENNPGIREAVVRQFDDEFAAWKERLNDSDAGYSDGRPEWASSDFDASGWPTMALPQCWEDAGYPDLDGTMWFRKEIELAAELASRPARLHFSEVNDRLQVWFNGVETVPWATNAQSAAGYPAPPETVRVGKNTVAVRVFDMGGKGGFAGSAADMWLRFDETGPSIPLAGEWRCQPGFWMKDFPPLPRPPLLHPNNANAPTGLFNAMIAPLAGFGMRGAIWYQGEANVARAEEYRSLFPALIRDWRTLWAQGDFPFLFVQLANYLPVKEKPEDDAMAELREAQAAILALPNTGMAVAIDIGDANDIHPRNKQDVAKRLALAARHIAYGEDVVYSGPVYAEIQRDRRQMHLRFAQVGGGLVAVGGGELEGFAVAGEDRRFVWAHARIEGESVRVWNEDVPEPVAVRYAWASNPVCNLYNKEGLPAVPFRTDDWPVVTTGKRLTLPEPGRDLRGN